MNYFFVGSANPVKVNSVKTAIISHWPKADVRGFEVASGVSAQPFTDFETKKGATNRARLALQAGLKELYEKNIKGSDQEIALGIGLEGGVYEVPEKETESGQPEMWTTVWVVIADRDGKTYASNGSRFLVPQIVAERIRLGEEMGIASQAISGIKNVKHKGGLIGIITEDFTNRTEEYSAIAKMSLGLWYGRNWQEKFIDISE